MMDWLFAFGPSALIALVAGVIGFVGWRAERFVLVVTLVVAPAIAGGVLWYLGEQMPGMDGLGHIAIAALGCGPVALGTLTGAVAAWLAGRRRAG